MTLTPPPPPRLTSSLDSLHDPVDDEVPALGSLDAGLAEVEGVGPDVEYSVEGDEDNQDNDGGHDDLVGVGVDHTCRVGQVRVVEGCRAVIMILHPERDKKTELCSVYRAECLWSKADICYSLFTTEL